MVQALLLLNLSARCRGAFSASYQQHAQTNHACRCAICSPAALQALEKASGMLYDEDKIPKASQLMEVRRVCGGTRYRAVT